MILVATTWIQAFTGTNLDFSSYSSHLKSVLGISQLQLNYLSVASDLGKAFGWCCGVSLFYLPLCLLLFMAAFMGLLGYGLQWLLIQRLVSLPYVLVSNPLSLSLSLNLMESVGKWDGKCMVVWFSFEFLNFWFYFLFLSVDLVCEAC